jgi:hypothetical protein
MGISVHDSIMRMIQVHEIDRLYFRKRDEGKRVKKGKGEPAAAWVRVRVWGRGRVS